MLPETPQTVNVVLVATHRLATDLLAGWLTGGGLGCKIVPHYGLDLSADDGQGVDLIVLGNLLNVMAPADVEQWITALRARISRTALVVVSDSMDARHSVECLRAGANGFIPTSLSLPLAFAALRLVLSGGIYIPAMALGLEPMAPLVQVRARPQDPPPEPVADKVPDIPLGQVAAPLPEERAALAVLGLSPRESDILLLLQWGASNRLLAAKLGISENTVMVHVRNVMRKLGATNRTEAVYTARRMLRENAAAVSQS